MLSPKFIIPIYQRTTSWPIKECQHLWADLLCAGAMEETAVHLIGSEVPIDECLGNLAVQSPKLMIAEGRANTCTACQNEQVRLAS